MTEWACRHIHAATLIRYALGDETHIRTEINEGRATCVFSDRDKARELQAEFFSGPVAVGDIRAFLQVAAQIRQTIKAAHDAGGVWKREDRDEHY